MKVYVWRHNKTYHSHSMINEPCVQNHFYLDALAIVAAESLEEALSKLAEIIGIRDFQPSPGRAV